MNAKDKARINRLNVKQSILTHYGNDECACVRCGFSDIRALSIDHIDGGGHEHRKSLRRGGLSFYKWLLENNYPEGYQTLCMNCQFIKTFRKDGPLSYTKSIAKRIRIWVGVREQPFNIRDILIGLGLPESKRGNIRVALFRLKRERVIKENIGPGNYKKLAKPVSVFASPNERMVRDSSY